MEQSKRKRGSGVKLAPEGYYMPREARNKLGLNESTFNYYVRKGRIKKYTPPLRREGFFLKREIDALAIELALFLHTQEERTTTETRIAQPADAQGIVEVLSSLGWQAATAEQRIRWYKINPYQDFIAVIDGKVAGYIWAVSFKPETLEDMMSGRKRAWHIQPSDILPYAPGTSHDLYIGIASRQDIEGHTQRVGFRLIAGFFNFLEELAGQQIIIRRLYAISDQKDGMDLCRNLGFTQQPKKEGDHYPRFMLDMQTSESRFARFYREAISNVGGSS